MWSKNDGKNTRIGNELGSIFALKLVPFLHILASWSRIGANIAPRWHLDLILDVLRTDFINLGTILAPILDDLGSISLAFRKFSYIRFYRRPQANVPLNIPSHV